MSPVKKKLHFYSRSTENFKIIKDYNIKFLVITLLHKNIVAARKLAMNQTIRKVSPYLDKYKYIKFKTEIEKIRTKTNSNDFFKLYNKQNGVCKFCNQPMEFENIVGKAKPEKLEIHHIKLLSMKKKQLDYSNKSLLHKSCHFRIHKIFKKN